MKKEELIEALDNIRAKHMCAYVSIGGKPNTFCDCKFSEHFGGFGKKAMHRGSENNNGCPEMRTIINFIKGLPETEF